MEYWESICPLIRDAWLEAAEYEEVGIAQDVCIRTVQNSFSSSLRTRLDDIVEACELTKVAGSARFRVHCEINRRFNGNKKETRLPTADVRGATDSVLPAIAIHDELSPRWNVLAIECWDVVGTEQFDQMASAKQKSLAYVGDDLKYENSLFLQFGRDGTLLEASLLRRSRAFERGIEPYIDDLIECDTVVKKVTIDRSQAAMHEAILEMADIAARCGDEDVRAALVR